MFRMSRKLAITLGTIAVLAVAGAAFAYFSTTGSGTGSATVGTSTPLTISGTTATTLYPGTSTTVSFTVDNTSPGSQHVGTITLGSVTTDAGHASCVLTDFTMPAVTANQTFPSGTGQTVTATGTLSMAAQPTTSQDGCKGAPLTLNLTSN
jgi:hypothetical protein